MRASWAARVAAGLLLRAVVASAQPTPAPSESWGRVLRVDNDLLVLDAVGSDLAAGQRVRLYRPLEVRHPVTRALLRDRYPLGVVTLHNVGSQLSVARVTEGLLRPPQVGDEVEPMDGRPREPPRRVEAPPATAAATPPPRANAPAVGVPLLPAASPTAPPPPPSAPVASPDDVAVLAAWRDTLGLAPEPRVERWTLFLRENPRSRHEAAVRAAIAQLQRDIDAPARERQSLRGAVGLTHGIPALRLGDVARFVMQVTHARVRPRGTLFVRRPGAEAYVSVPLLPQADRYVVGEVPASLVTLDGFEYFVALEGEAGEVAVMGSAQSPTVVTVTRRAEDPVATADRTRIDLRAEYVDVGSRTVSTPGGPLFRAQRFLLVEGDFFQRLGLPVLYGFRAGFGVYEGEGVPLSQIERPTPSTRSSVIYGYHELELEVTRGFHVMLRGALGVHGEGIVGGAQLRLRIGEETRTNLVLGGDLFQEIGQRGFFALNLNVHPRVPLLAQGEVFNQSVSDEDPMFRFIVQAGYRIAPWLTVSARGSYQLRNIQNGGFGGGLSTIFHW